MGDQDVAVDLDFPADLLAQIDEAARAARLTREQYVVDVMRTVMRARDVFIPDPGREDDGK